MNPGNCLYRIWLGNVIVCLCYISTSCGSFGIVNLQLLLDVTSSINDLLAVIHVSGSTIHFRAKAQQTQTC